MNSFFSGVFRWLLYGNLFVSAIAPALAFATVHALDLPPLSPAVYIFLFSAAMLQYNVHGLLFLRQMPQANWNENFRWLNRNRIFIFVITVLSVIGAIVPLFFFSPTLIYCIAILAVFSLAYEIPVFLPKESWGVFKQFATLKSVHLSLAWTAVTIIIPLVACGATEITTEIILLFATRFLIILPIATGFDARDEIYDRSVGIITLPVILGRWISVFEYSVGAILCLVSFYQLHLTGKIFQMNANVLSMLCIITVLHIIRQRKNNLPDWFHLLWLDGTLMLYSLLLIIH